MQTSALGAVRKLKQYCWYSCNYVHRFFVLYERTFFSYTLFYYKNFGVEKTHKQRVMRGFVRIEQWESCLIALIAMSICMLQTRWGKKTM